MRIEQEELDRFEKSLQAYLQGEINDEEFRKIRVWQGVYLFRGTKDRFIIRIKVPQGRTNASQLEGLGEIARKFSQDQRVHITTRQGFELYAVSAEHLMEVLRSLLAVGLSTRETGGNCVRNITTCSFSGISPEESFDVTPYARATTDYFLRNPSFQNLPRKIKIAFEGCSKDHVRAMIGDIGVFAVEKDGVGGFEIYVGGGLGGSPRQAELIEPFTRPEELLPTLEAVLTVFNLHGSRQSRDRSRLKFLLKDWGIEKFQQAVLDARRQLCEQKRDWPVIEKISPSWSAKTHPKPSDFKPGEDPSFERWLTYNVFVPKQKEFLAVCIWCPLGDLKADQLKNIAGIVRQFCQDEPRTTLTQNILLRGIYQSRLMELYFQLKQHQLTLCCAERVMDITRCAGAGSCLSAITHSGALTVELGKIFSNGFSQYPNIMELIVKVSGCPHGCGQHMVADIGLFGSSKSIDNRQVPHYQILVGGSTARGKATFARPLVSVPARKVPEAITQLLTYYLQKNKGNEKFSTFVQGGGFELLQKELTPYTFVPSYSSDPSFYRDWGSQGDYRVQAGKGECFA